MPNTKPIEGKVEELIKGALAAMEYELVRVQATPGGRYLTLQVMTERADRKPMTVEDCAKISHTLSPKLDETDLLGENYTLEISSPGVERPLMRLQDFERFTGHMARVELNMPIEGERRFQGSIIRVTGDAPDAAIEFKTDTGAVRVPVNAIAKARLVLDAPAKTKDGTKH